MRAHEVRPLTRISRRALAGLACAALLLLLVPLPRDRALRAVGDLGHAPLFGLLALALYGPLRRRFGARPLVPVVAAFLLAVLAGSAVEVIQGAVGRHAGLEDAAADGLGALAALAWMEGARAAALPRRLGLTAVGFAALGLASAEPALNLVDTVCQRLEMPLLSSFEHPLEMSRWSFYRSRGSRVKEGPTHGSRALRVDLEPGDFPGATLVWPPPDWAAWRSLRVDVDLDTGEPLPLTVRVEDARHRRPNTDVFERVLPVWPGRQEICVALSDVAAGPVVRRLDLRRVTHLEFYVAHLSRPRSFHLDHLRLSDRLCRNEAGGRAPRGRA
jgi:hypothetical protein